MEKEQMKWVEILLEIWLECFNRSKERLERRSNIMKVRIFLSGKLEFEHGVRKIDRLIKKVL